MKKVLSAALAFVLCVAMVFAFSGCMFKSPVAKFADRLEKQNYKIEVKALFVESEMEVDGNITYTEAMGSETYEVKDGDTITIYTKESDGEWKVEEEKVDEDKDENIADLFDSDAWDKVEKGEYELVDEDLMKEFEVKEAVLKIEDDEYELTMETEDGMEVTMTFSEFGKIELEVPDVD